MTGLDDLRFLLYQEDRDVDKISHQAVAAGREGIDYALHHLEGLHSPLREEVLWRILLFDRPEGEPGGASKGVFTQIKEYFKRVSERDGASLLLRLRNLDLSFMFLDRRSFLACDLFQANLQNIKLSSCVFVDTRLYQVNLEDARFQGVRLQNTRFRQCDMDRFQDKSSSFGNSLFERCSLKGAQFQSTKLDGLRFVQCDLTDASFEFLNQNSILLADVRFDTCDLTDARFEHCSLVVRSWEGSILDWTSFRDCTITGGSFSGIDLRKTRFKRVRIEGTDFSGARLEGLDLRSCNLRHVKLLDMASWDSRTRWPPAYNLPEGFNP